MIWKLAFRSHIFMFYSIQCFTKFCHNILVYAFFISFFSSAILTFAQKQSPTLIDVDRLPDTLETFRHELSSQERISAIRVYLLHPFPSPCYTYTFSKVLLKSHGVDRLLNTLKYSNQDLSSRDPVRQTISAIS